MQYRVPPDVLHFALNLDPGSPIAPAMTTPSRAFTLIELLIVVAIIAILAAIAVPNFLEAQTRSKVSRVKADLRNLATGIQSFHSDHNHYPLGTDDTGKIPAVIQDHFNQSSVAPGASGAPYSFYTFQTVDLPETVQGHSLTTPIAYITSIPTDPFASVPGIVTYSYREGRDGDRTGWILTSFGPDRDDLVNGGKNNGCGALCGEMCGRHGDISEVHALPGSGRWVTDLSTRLAALSHETYDPTNGTISEGDLWRIGP